MGWKINLWARFLDGDHAHRILRNLIQPAVDTGPSASRHGGLYPNLFDAHPPFQIDGNFGATAGIAEMLVQSHDPYATPTGLSGVQSGEAAIVHLLPALPSAFPSGSASGLRARGGLEVDIAWRDGKLTRATFRARKTMPLKVRYAGKEVQLKAAPGKTYSLGPGLQAATQ
jgi:alpha-L-fucosidase 2